MSGFTYKSYSFIDKDPIIDFVRTVIEDSGKTLEQISYESGVAQGTIRNWLYGGTKRPQATTLNAVLRVCGHKLDITDINTPSIIKPTPRQVHTISFEELMLTGRNPIFIKNKNK